MNFNPYAPHALGCAWMALLEVSALVESSALAVVESTVTEDIDTAWIYLLGQVGDGGRYEIEVWDLDVLNNTDFVINQEVYVPAEDADNTRAQKWTGAAFSPTDLWQALDDSSATDWVQGTNDALSWAYSFRADNTPGFYDDLHVVGLRLKARLDIEGDDLAVASMTVTPYIRIGDKRYVGEVVTTDDQAAGPVTVTYTWPANPATGATWDGPALDEFATSGTSSMGFIVEPTGREDAVPKVIWAQMIVLDVGTDLREAISGSSILDDNDEGLGWVTATLTNKLTGLAWLKDADRTYLVVLNRWAGTGSRTWRYLDSRLGPVANFRVAPQQVPARGGTPVPGPPFWTSGDVVYRPNTALIIRPVTDISRSPAYSIVLGYSNPDPSDPTISLDSQPYASIYDDGVSGSQARGRFVPGNASVSGYRPWTRVQTCNQPLQEPTQAIEQDLTPTETLDYGHLLALVQVIPAQDGSVPDDLAPLQVRVYRRADNELISPVLEITLDDLDPDRTLDPQIISKEFDSTFELAADIQYYVRFDSDAVAGEGSWRVQVLSDVPDDLRNPPLSEFAQAAFGEGIDQYHIRSNPTQDYDGGYSALAIVAMVQTQPDTPEDFAVASTGAPSGVPCGPGDYDDAVNDVAITWTPTAISTDEGGGFAVYEIQRDDPTTDLGFQTIALLPDETCDSFLDREACVGDPIYRMRVIREDGSPSRWTDEESVEVEANFTAGLLFSSNYDYDYALWFDMVGPTTSWSFRQNMTPVEMEGRDGQFAIRENADRFDQFSRTLVVYHRKATCSPLGTCDPTLGRAMFDDLTIMCGAARDPITGEKPGLPYVCVRDCNGRRWFADVNVSSGSRTEPVRYHAAEIDVLELQRVPYVVDSSCEGSGEEGSGCEVDLGPVYDPLAEIVWEAFYWGDGPMALALYGTTEQDITTVPDETGNGHTLSPSGAGIAPTYNPGTAGGPSAFYTSANVEVVSAAASFALAAPYSVAFVLTTSASTGSAVGGQGATVAPVGRSGLDYTYRFGGTAADIGEAALSAVAGIVVCRSTGLDSAMLRLPDGTIYDVTDSVGNTTLTALGIGGNADATGTIPTVSYVVGVFDGDLFDDLTPSDLAALESWLFSIQDRAS